jgi:hypothetical protein
MAVEINAKDAGIPNVSADPGTLVSVLNATYFVAGAIAVLVMVIAGFLFVTSNGSPERIKVARFAVLAAAIGLVVILMASAITAFIIQGAA